MSNSAFAALDLAAVVALTSVAYLGLEFLTRRRRPRLVAIVSSLLLPLPLAAFAISFLLAPNPYHHEGAGFGFFIFAFSEVFVLPTTIATSLVIFFVRRHLTKRVGSL